LNDLNIKAAKLDLKRKSIVNIGCLLHRTFTSQAELEKDRPVPEVRLRILLVDEGHRRDEQQARQRHQGDVRHPGVGHRSQVESGIEV